MTTYHTLTCDHCKKQFKRSAKSVAAWHCKDAQSKFCSRKCHNKSRVVSKTHPCANCGKDVLRKPSELRRNKSNRVFCNSSCAATYNNTHKTTGTRRSKLEKYIEQRLKADFPDLTIVCNGKDEIGSELDFYFPQLRLAIEVNGIFHYEPIYGQEKLEQIQNNDKQKMLRCADEGIELCVINTAGHKRLTKTIKERYYQSIRSLISSVVKRAD